MSVKIRPVILHLVAWLSFGAAGPLLTTARATDDVAPAPARPHRLIVLTDIEADPDDTQSLVRLMLYTDVIDLEGLVATTSCWKRTSIAPESIRAVVHAYGQVRPRLLEHDARYPTAEALEALIKAGRPEYGMSGVGAGKDSEGSAWIIRRLEENDDRPLWVAVWGGANTLAQALHTLRATKSEAELARLVAKLRVYAISDQDDSGPWLRKNFPALFYIVSPGGDYSSATWSAIHAVVPGVDNTVVSNSWLAAHLQQGHGPLGAAYPDVAWGMEGDTPSWLNLIPNGLSDPEHPDWGGWGGRYELAVPKVAVDDPKTFVADEPIPPETRPIWTNATDEYAPPTKPDFGRATRPGERPVRDNKVTLWRWRDDFQNDFAARMEWTTKPYAQTNHPPVPVLDRPDAFTVKSGQGFSVSARRTSDPDGDSLSYFWFQYREAGSYRGTVDLGAQNTAGVWVTAPKVDHPETLHLIVRVTDKGTPPLSRYKRVVVTVVP